ncbi:hypothetical protein BDZ94DRAFT_813089 [Collybia nuda]|uniref:Uncharacterized protein n=1 Tax=Collybia nuda TaxID=64659 RepID=A0A9P6CI20_9AGAR|nr:hypothetical protein BDZ94DRAFT_813089 [Collybia nuda]
MTGHGVWPASYSPFGQVVNPTTGLSIPVSHNTKFFEELFGYTDSNPQRTYEELIDAFRLQRSADARNGSGPTTAGFTDFLEKVQASKMVPNWWKEDVHVPAILAFSETDEWARLDRVVDDDQIFMRHTDGGKRRPSIVKLRLQMMSERIWGTKF